MFRQQTHRGACGARSRTEFVALRPVQGGRLQLSLVAMARTVRMLRRRQRPDTALGQGRRNAPQAMDGVAFTGAAGHEDRHRHGERCHADFSRWLHM